MAITGHRLMMYWHSAIVAFRLIRMFQMLMLVLGSLQAGPSDSGAGAARAARARAGKPCAGRAGRERGGRGVRK